MCPVRKTRHFSLCVVYKIGTKKYNYVRRGGKILGSEKNRRVPKRIKDPKTNDTGTGSGEI